LQDDFAVSSDEFCNPRHLREDEYSSPFCTSGYPGFFQSPRGSGRSPPRWHLPYPIFVYGWFPFLQFPTQAEDPPPPQESNFSQMLNDNTPPISLFSLSPIFVFLPSSCRKWGLSVVPLPHLPIFLSRGRPVVGIYCKPFPDLPCFHEEPPFPPLLSDVSDPGPEEEETHSLFYTEPPQYWSSLNFSTTVFFSVEIRWRLAPPIFP